MDSTPEPRPIEKGIFTRLDPNSTEKEGYGMYRILTASNDIYEGKLKNWKRHGKGTQSWSTGEVFKGIWDTDLQHKGTFTDTKGRKWQGDFKANKVKLLQDDVTRRYLANPLQKKDKKPTKPGGPAPHRVKIVPKRSPRASKPLQMHNFSIEQGERALALVGELEVGEGAMGRFEKPAHPNDTPVPGPGAYSPGLEMASHQMASPKFSMGGLSRGFVEDAISLHKDSPGPMYNPGNSARHKRTDGTMAGMHRPEVLEALIAHGLKDKHLQGPGPKYAREDLLVAKVGTNVGVHRIDATTFGVGPRREKATARYLSAAAQRELIGTQGAEYVNISSKMLGQTVPAYSFGHRRSIIKNHDKVPPPGTYNPEYQVPTITHAFSKSVKSVCPHTTRAKIPYTSRRHARADNTGVFSPGPGAYAANKNSMTHGVRTTSFKPHTNFFRQNAQQLKKIYT